VERGEAYWGFSEVGKSKTSFRRGPATSLRTGFERLMRELKAGEKMPG